MTYCWQCLYWYPEAQFAFREGINYCEKKKQFNICPYRKACFEYVEREPKREGY